MEMPLYFFKALGILGFPSFQSLDQTEYEDICSSFLNKLMTVMKNRKQAMMKAQENRNKPKSQNQIQSRLRREKSWRVEVVMINEAFQVRSTSYIFQLQKIIIVQTIVCVSRALIVKGSEGNMKEIFTFQSGVELSMNHL